jgi:small subunit ribosomal protein S16
MVRVRLARAGAKKRPFYHIIVTDKEKPRDGRFMERIGLYDPSRPISEVRIDQGRLDYWVQRGARVSERVHKIVNKYRRAETPSETTQSA